MHCKEYGLQQRTNLHACLRRFRLFFFPLTPLPAYMPGYLPSPANQVRFPAFLADREKKMIKMCNVWNVP